MIEVGSIVGAYEIKAMEKGYCYAERIKKIHISDYVVWSVDYNKKGVNTGRYFENKDAAIQRYYARSESSGFENFVSMYNY